MVIRWTTALDVFQRSTPGANEKRLALLMTGKTAMVGRKKNICAISVYVQPQGRDSGSVCLLLKGTVGQKDDGCTCTRGKEEYIFLARREIGNEIGFKKSPYLDQQFMWNKIKIGPQINKNHIMARKSAALLKLCSLLRFDKERYNYKCLHPTVWGL